MKKMRENEDFGIKKRVSSKQMELFPGFWEDIINEKKTKIYKEELEWIRKTEEPSETVEWIKHPATRIKTLKLNSDKKWVEYETITKAIPTTEDAKKHYNYNPNAKTEIFEFEVMMKRNKDLLGIESYEDMGLTHYEEPMYPMDKVHFNECCTRNGTHLLALYEKNHLDFKKDFWVSEEWLTEKLNISYKEAQRLAYAFERLDLDKKAVLKLMYGYMSDRKVEEISKKKSWRMKEYEKDRHMTKGMLAMAKVNDGNQERIGLPEVDLIHDFIDYIEDLADVMPKLKKNDLGSGETNMNIGDPERLDWVKTIMKTMADEVPDKDEYEDRFDYAKDAAFGTHKLFYGEEGCSHELLTYINNCDREELKGMKSAMFPRKGTYGYIKAEYWYLTGSQKSQVWRYIKDREEKLNNADAINL